MSITTNTLRHGNATSSEIVSLVKKGKTRQTYIQEMNMERRLGRSLSDEIRAKPLTWGKLIERYAFSKLPLEYELSSQDTILHPTIPYWAGSPDGTAPDTVIDIKCPLTLKSFCQLVDGTYNGLKGMDAIKSIIETHKEGEKYYWQLVSNAILTGSKYAELIVYMPYESELEEIKSLAEGDPGCYWVWAALDNELPFLPDGGFYKNINIIRFEVPEADIKILTNAVESIKDDLIAPNQSPSVIIAHHDNDINATIIQ